MVNSFLPSKNQNDKINVKINVGDDFFPTIDLDDFTQTMEISGMAQTAIINLLQSSIIAINQKLSNWQKKHKTKGKNNFAAIADHNISFDNLNLNYKLAVYFLTKSLINSTHFNYDSTNKKNNNEDMLFENINHLQSQSNLHLAALMGAQNFHVGIV